MTVVQKREAAEYALHKLSHQGASQVSIITSDGFTEELNAEAGEFSLYRTLFNSALSIKVIKNRKKGVSATTSLQKEAIDDALLAALAAADAGVEDEAEGIAEFIENRSFESGVMLPDKEKLFLRIQEYICELGARYPLINLEQFIAHYVQNHSLLINSNGVEMSASQGFYEYMSMFSGHDGDRSTSFNGYGVRFLDVDSPLMEMGMMRQMLDDTVHSFGAAPIEGKFTGPVILTPGCVTDFFATVIQLFAGEGTLLQGTAIWKDKLGSRVAHPLLNLSFSPLDPRIICGERFTADGYVSSDADLLRDGVLQSFLLSRYGSLKTGRPRSANLSGNIIIAPGNHSLADMITDIDRGLIVNRFSGGAPAANGDFSGVAKNSFSIIDGKISGPVSETMISGNLEAICQNIRAISRETICDGSSVLPWISVDGVTISGAG